MNKKGQTLQGFLMIFIAVIVGVILLTASAQNIGDVTNTVDVANQSINCQTNGTTLANIDQLRGKYASGLVVYNGSDDVVITSAHYTLYNNQVINGEETAGINCSSKIASYKAQNWNVSYTYQPTTYESNAGGRAVAGLIIIFFALAIAVITLVPTLRSGVLDMVKR